MKHSPSEDKHEILARTPAGHPRGSWPAEEIASRLDGTVVQDPETDEFLVIAVAVTR